MTDQDKAKLIGTIGDCLHRLSAWEITEPDRSDHFWNNEATGILESLSDAGAKAIIMEDYSVVWLNKDAEAKAGQHWDGCPCSGIRHD